MINPPLLRAGDTIGIAATGRKIAAKDVEAAKSIFTSWGMDVSIGSNLYSSYHNYLSGSFAVPIESAISERFPPITWAVALPSLF